MLPYVVDGRLLQAEGTLIIKLEPMILILLLEGHKFTATQVKVESPSKGQISLDHGVTAEATHSMLPKSMVQMRVRTLNLIGYCL